MPVSFPTHIPPAFLEAYLAEIHEAWERVRTGRNREAHLVLQLDREPKDGQAPWEKQVRYVG